MSIERGDQFKINEGCHRGRLYTVRNFAPSKSGTRYIVCSWSDRPGDCFLFSEAEIKEFGPAFQMWDTNQRDAEAASLERLERERTGSAKVLQFPLEAA